MSDKSCQCKFCIDYKRFKQVLPLIPLEHREWFESVFDSRWNAEEELSYKAAVLDGTWPDAVEILSHHLENARRKHEVEEKPLNFDCKVCEVCNKAMTSAKYWAHPCQQVAPPAKVVADDYEDEDMEDDGFFGGDHAGDFF